MANQLKMAMIETIVSLRRRGWSQRRIARELGINRETVARHLRAEADAAKPAKAPIGAANDAASSKPANAPIGAEVVSEAPAPQRGTPPRRGRASDCEPWRAWIEQQRDQGLTAQRIYQDLVTEHGFTGSYYSVRRLVGQLEGVVALPFRRLECGPGEEAQVDFGTGAPVLTAEGKRRRTHVFRIVLSYSRKAYSEVVYRQTTEAFLGCLENAWWHFGGNPQRLVLDNLRAAVTQADWYDPDLNPKVRDFATHYGTVFLPTRPYTPRHKGKVERGVGYVRSNALRGRTFSSLEEENRFLAEWEANVADKRLHGTTRRQVGASFVEVERAALQPLPAQRFPFFHEGQRIVHRDGHIEVAHAYYSVPPEYLGRRVWVRWDSRLLRICNDRWETIALHPRHEPGRFSTQPQHIAANKISGVERGKGWILGRLQGFGPQVTQWAEAVLAVRGVEAIRVLLGLRQLAQRHPRPALEQACAVAHSYGAYRLRTLRRLLDRQAPPQQQFTFLDEHPLIRPLADYSHFVLSTKEVCS